MVKSASFATVPPSRQRATQIRVEREEKGVGRGREGWWKPTDKAEVKEWGWLSHLGIGCRTGHMSDHARGARMMPGVLDHTASQVRLQVGTRVHWVEIITHISAV